MKKSFFSLYLLALLGTAHAHSNDTGCAARKAAVQQQMKYAEAYHNYGEKTRLKLALEDIDNNCSEEGLRAQRQQRVLEKQQRVDQRKADLEQARVRGDLQRIANKQQRLEHAERELQEAKDAMNR